MRACKPIAGKPESEDQKAREHVVEGDLPGIDAALLLTDLEGEEGTDERQPVLDEVRRRREDSDRPEHRVARAAEHVGAHDVDDREQADEDPADVAVDERKDAASERRAADEVEPHRVRLPTGPVDSVAGCDEDQPRDDRRVLLGAQVDERDRERQGDREHEQRRPEALEGDERGTDRQQFEEKEPGIPVATGQVLVEDADPGLQRSHEDGEEDHRERDEHPRGHGAAALLESEGEPERNRRCESAIADEGSSAVVLAQDPEQGGGRKEHDHSADVDEGAPARPTRPQRVGRQQALDRHVTNVDERAGRRRPARSSASSRRRRRWSRS